MASVFLLITTSNASFFIEVFLFEVFIFLELLLFLTLELLASEGDIFGGVISDVLLGDIFLQAFAFFLEAFLVGASFHFM